MLLLYPLLSLQPMLYLRELVIPYLMRQVCFLILLKARPKHFARYVLVGRDRPADVVFALTVEHFGRY